MKHFYVITNSEKDEKLKTTKYIYDKTHKEALLHRARAPWILISGDELDEELTKRVTEREKEFACLWRGFFQAIAIEERRNPSCQRTHLPLHFRKDMLEFDDMGGFEVF